MDTLDVAELRSAIVKAGDTWLVRALPPDEPAHGLGWEPSPAAEIQQAEAVAKLLVQSRLDLATFFGPAKEKAALVAGAPAAPARPSAFDWRSRGVIGPVRNQRNCGSCVSFAVTGLVAAQAGIELGTVDLLLSEADEHFCSSHGANCGGWNNGDALNQIKTRGICTDATFPYMSAFDSPPVSVPVGNPNALWRAYCRPENQRAWHTYRITDVSAWTGDARKVYLATVGPLVCGFTVYEDFDSYGGGVYHHVSGKVRGGHAVLVVGYSDVEQAWICRNSWGPGFGGAARADGTGGGFFKIGYGQCNIDSEAFHGCHGVIPPAIMPMVTAAARGGDRLDLFAAAADHGTFTAASMPGNAGWQDWMHLQGGVAAPGTFLHAVSRSPNLLDAFTVGTDQGVYTAAWQPGDTTWRGWWRVGNLQVAPNTSVFGVSRSADKLDIFAVGADHKVYTAAWQAGDTTWRGWWPVAGGVAPGTSPYAVSRATDKLMVLCIASDYSIITSSWQPGNTSWQAWQKVPGSTVEGS